MVRTPSRRKAWALTLPTPGKASRAESRVMGALEFALSAVTLTLALGLLGVVVAVAAAGFFLVVSPWGLCLPRLWSLPGEIGPVRSVVGEHACAGWVPLWVDGVI